MIKIKQISVYQTKLVFFFTFETNSILEKDRKAYISFAEVLLKFSKAANSVNK